MTEQQGRTKKITIKTKAKTVIERGKGRSKVKKTDSIEQEQATTPADAQPLTDSAPDDPPGYGPGNSRAPAGRIAATIRGRPTEWFLPDIIPREALTLVVGVPSAGKSTMGSWLCSLARRPVILPGYEESVDIHLVPRLSVNDAPMEDCLILDTRHWAMPHDRAALTEALRNHGADLLWIDPIDSYNGDAQENDGPAVRTCLEALVRVAQDVPCAVVAARHPGKLMSNLCPGSRQWYAVPRAVIQLTYDEGPPERRFLKVRKPAAGSIPEPRKYELVGAPKEPKRFLLGPTADAGDVEVSEVADQIDRLMIEQAEDLLRALLADGEQESGYVYTTAERERLKERLVRKAAKRLGVKIRRQGTGKEHSSWWYLPDSGTPALLHRDTPRPETTAGGGVSQSGGRSAGVKRKPDKKGVSSED